MCDSPNYSTYQHLESLVFVLFFFTFEIYSSINLLRYKSQAVTFAGFKDAVWLTSVLVYSYVTIATINIQTHSQPFYCPPKVPSACCLQWGQSTGLWPCLPHPISYNLPFTEFHINGVTQGEGFHWVFFEIQPLCCVQEYFLYPPLFDSIGPSQFVYLFVIGWSVCCSQLGVLINITRKAIGVFFIILE